MMRASQLLPHRVLAAVYAASISSARTGIQSAASCNIAADLYPTLLKFFIVVLEYLLLCENIKPPSSVLNVNLVQSFQNLISSNK